MNIGPLATSASQLIFGTSVAGFGYNLGKGTFNSLKKYWQVLLVILVLAGALILPFISMSKSLRWYPIGKLKWFFTKLLPWGIVSMLGLAMILAILAIPTNDSKILNEMAIAGFKSQEDVLTVYSLAIWGILSLIGLVDGIIARKKRKQAYALELYNQRFLTEQGIVEVDGADTFTHYDSSGEKLRFTSIGRDAIEFFVIGRKNKRAYIFLDSEGRFTEYTGVVSV